MADESFRKTYYAHEFLALGGASLAESKGVIDAALSGLELGVPVNETRLALGGSALIVEWAALPASQDVAAVDALIPTIVGVATTSEPFEFESLGVTNATVQDSLVDKIDETTPPLDGGTYDASWNCLIGMLATVANTGVRAVFTITRTQGGNAVSRSWETASSLQQPVHFGSSTTFTVLAGATIRTRLQVSKLGVAAATAQMASARVTIDQKARAGE